METDAKTIPLLDHGYLRLIETWGSDERIVESARMSTGKGFNGWGGAPCPKCKAEGRLNDGDNLFKSVDHIRLAELKCDCNGSGKTSGDEKLLKFLYAHKHLTPFEMAGLIVEVQAPIFVFREWHRHRTGQYNEMSARYAPLPDLNYVPTVERLMMNAGTSNKQAGTVPGSAALVESRAKLFRENLLIHYERCQILYEDALSDGVPKELARVHLPVGRYSRMRASMNLRNWLQFMTLRSAPDAQWEIRQFSDAIGALIADAFPRTWVLFKGEA